MGFVGAWPAAAAAAEGAAPSAQSVFVQFVPLILIFLVFYFLLIRPQQKRIKAHQELVNSLKKGDKIITGGGIYAEVVDAKPGEDWIKVQIADGVRVRIKRSTIQGLAD
ncbi:MAG: preprotein translocase subunit YajC [Zetaproteobacteria bacterium]|nr:MAG: preprotein translocase subunit YajC [Zetaproteobacteria bacterium]